MSRSLPKPILVGTSRSMFFIPPPSLDFGGCRGPGSLPLFNVVLCGVQRLSDARYQLVRIALPRR